MCRSALVALVALAFAAATASALPSDPAITLQSPADGATTGMPTLAAPASFTFSCPTYHPYAPTPPLTLNDVPLADWTYYFGEIATKPDLGPDGTLALAFQVGSFSAFPANADETACKNGATAFTPTPGVYYWQVHRVCATTPCSPDDYSPVYSFTVAAPPSVGAPPNGSAPPSAPVLSGTDARNATRWVVRKRAGRSVRGLVIKCRRHSSIKYVCRTSWSTKRYAWSGNMTMELDSGTLYYSFKGYKTSFACVKRRRATAPCMRKVRW